MRRTSTKLRTWWKIIVLVFLLAIVFSYAMFEGGFVSWFLFYSFLPFCLYGICLAIYPMKDFKVKIKTEQRKFTAGDTVILEIHLERGIPLPLPYLLVEELISDESIQVINKKQHVIFPHFHKKLVCKLPFEQAPRGEHHFTNVRIKMGDLLGLVEKNTWVDCNHTILVYPAIFPVTYQAFLNRYEQGKFASQDRILRDTTMATGVRKYQTGDRFSWINWKVTARQNEIMTKEFEQRQSQDAFIVMDQTSCPQFEQIISFTASLLVGMIANDVQVGFLSSGNEQIHVPVNTGTEQGKRLLYHLAKLKEGRSLPFHEVIDREAFYFHQNTNLIFISSKLEEQWLQKVIAEHSKKREVVVFVVKRQVDLLSQSEKLTMEMARKHRVRVKVIRQDTHYGDFLEVRQ